MAYLNRCLRLLRFCVLAVTCGGLSAIAFGQDVKPVERFADPLPSPERVPFEQGKFAIRPGEVVVFTGPANGVFEQQQGWLETLLAASAKDSQPIFRHMCWEGDTVYEQWRAMNFGSWAEQFEAVGASTMFLWFGQSEALDETRGVEEFTAAYGKLIDEFSKRTPRLVIIAPPPFEKPANEWIRNNTPRNERVKAFAEAAKKLAAERGTVFVDIFTPLSARQPEPRLTEDGMHFTAAGQRIVGEQIATSLGANAKWADALEPLRKEIIAKNQLWFDCWRTMNWYFPFGDRTWASFDKPAGDYPNLAKELEKYKPLIRTADARVHAVALGKAPPELPPVKPEPVTPLQPPDEEMKTFQLRDGFDVNLFASEADGLIKPTQMCWDERGRLWATCAPSYPQLVPGEPPKDYILVCEDTDGDGRVDKSFKFAEGLVMPTGLALGDGGVYVCETMQLVHLRDTNGDGKADERRVILSGFGTGDSHQCINSLCWGPDGRLWFTQGLHIFSLVETPWGLSRCHKTGIWRLNPRSRELHNFLGNAAATENAWGVGFDDWGQTFYTPGNEPGTFFITPALVPLPMEQLQKMQYTTIGRLAATGPKGMRTEFLSSQHLPDDLQSVLAKSTYIAGYVELSRIADNASGFKSELMGNLISSPSPAFRPIETRVGPDGAIYICDWFNPIIGHYQASYRDPKRDHVHGRIWRMTAKGRPLTKMPPLTKMNTNELIGQLASPDRWVREQVQRLLADRPAKEVIAAVDASLANAGDPASLDTARMLYEAATVHANHEEVRPDFLKRLLESPEPRLRAFGTHLVGLWASRLPDPLALLRPMAVDDFPRVRLEAIVAASYVPSPQAIEVATLAVGKPRDPFIDYALQQTVRMLKPHWYPALLRGEISFDNNGERLRFVLEADGTKDVIGFLRGLIDNPNTQGAARERLMAVLINVGTPDDLRFALDRGQKNAAVLNELASIAKVHKRLPTGDVTGVVRPLLGNQDETLRLTGLRLAKAWHTTGLVTDVRRQLAEAKSAAVLAAAIDAVMALEGKEAVATIEPFAGKGQPPEVRAAAISALGTVDLDRAAALAAGLLQNVTSEPEISQLILPIVERRGGGQALSKALDSASVSSDTAKIVLRVLNGAGRADGGLVEALNHAIGIQGAKIEYSPELVKKLAADSARGDATRGRAVFLSKLANCTACHKVTGQGGDIGPDLSAVGKAMPAELIVESLLWPNRQVKEGFLAVRVQTADGQVFTGYKLNESVDEIQLRDTSVNQLRRIAKSDIEEIVNAGSVMPEGLTGSMTSDEVRDLLRYLSELGKETSAK